MLHITDNYYAISNNYGYTVARDTGRKNKDESPVYITLGYVGMIKEVVEMVCKDKFHNRIIEGDMELKQALEFIKEQTDRIEEALGGIAL